MLWVVFALLTAFFMSCKDLFSRRALKDLDEYIVAWSVYMFAIPFLLFLLLFFKIPKLDSTFWLALLITTGVGTLSQILYMKAIKTSGLSKTVPMLAFTPLFMLITSPLILGEFPGSYGLIGIFLIVLGSYSLNIKQFKKGILEPFKCLVKERGPLLMLAVAFIWSIAGNVDKIAIQHSSAFFYPLIFAISLCVSLSFVTLHKSKNKLKSVLSNSKNLKFLAPLGFSFALLLIFQMIALTLTIVPYVVAIKRISVLFSVLWGYFIFREGDIKEKLIGTMIMLVGVLFIVFL